VALAGFHDDVATLAAVAPGWASAGNKLLPAEGEAAVAAVAGLYADCGFIDEHGGKKPSAISHQEHRPWSSVVRRWPNPNTKPVYFLRSGTIRSRMIPRTRISFYSSTKKLRLVAGAVSAFPDGWRLMVES
jgi:hypothetical protein